MHTHGHIHTHVWFSFYTKDSMLCTLLNSVSWKCLYNRCTDLPNYFKWLHYNISLYESTILLNYCPTDGYFGCFQYFAITNSSEKQQNQTPVMTGF